MAAIDFRADPRGINQLANGPEMHALLRARAEDGAAWVRANAPVETHAYRDSIQVSDLGRGGPRRDRAALQVAATAPHAVFVEQGSHGRPGLRLLARSVDVIERG